MHPGYLVVPRGKDGIEEANRWYHRCRRVRHPYVVVTNRGPKNADVRVELETMVAHSTAPVPTFTEEDWRDVRALLADTARAIRGVLGSDHLDLTGVPRSDADAVAAAILAICLRKHG